MDLEALAKQYGGFLKPFHYITIDGKKLEDKTLVIEDISVILTSGYESSICSLNVLGKNSKYSEDELKVNPGLAQNFKLGSKIEVFMGYGSEKTAEDTTKMVFSGVITSIEFAYSYDDVRYMVEAMDVKAFMMNNRRSELKKDITKYSDAVTNVLKDYSALYEAMTVDQTEELTVPIEQYNQSDYDFVVGIARKINYLFFVVQGKVYFIKYTTNKDSTVTITPGRYLRYFRREKALNNQVKSVTVRSNDELNPDEPFEGKATSVDVIGNGSQGGSDVSSFIDENKDRLIIDNTIKSAAEAKARAEAELLKISMQFATGEFEVIGIPEIEPGKFVTVQKINEEFDNDYFITEVKHVMNEDGYKTICKFEVNKI